MKVGYLRFRETPTIFVRCLFALSSMYKDMEIFYFTPERIDTNKKTIRGLFCVEGELVERETTYPDIIDERGDFRYYHKELYCELLKDCIFVSNPIGGKTKQIYALKTNNLSKYIINTYGYRNSNIDELLEKHGALVLKPNDGIAGQGVYKLYKKDGYYLLHAENNIEKLTREEFSEKYNVESMKKYIIQEFINSTTNNGCSFDLRVDVRRNKDGKWELMAIMPRIGSGRMFTSNLSAGGSLAIYPDKFLKSEFGDEWKSIYDELIFLSEAIPDIMQNASVNLISAFGIDVAINRDKNNELKIFEINTVPMEGVAYHFEIAEYKIQYYMYLSKNREEILKRQKPQFL